MKTTILKKTKSPITLIFYGFIAVVLLTVSCKKEKPQRVLFDEYGLPVIAGNGGNYFGYLLNGKPIWLQKDNGDLGSIKATYWESTGRFEFSGSYDNDDVDYSLYIKIRDTLKEGETYELKENDYSLNHSAILYKTIPDDVFDGTIIAYVSYNEEPGYIKIEQWDK